MSEDDDIVMMTWNFCMRKCTINEFLPFSTCHRYTALKRVFLH